MHEEIQRKKVDENHRYAAFEKLTVLIEQRIDLTIAVDQFLDEIKRGKNR